MEKLSHAYIVSSASEEAALDKAYELAAEMLCSGAGEKPCGVCRDCRKVKARVHPDLTLVSRLTDDKGNRKKEILVDQIRNMSADTYILPNEAAGKVYIIERADTMNEQAQNAALKLFEEPPSGVHFILCVQNAERLLPTVRSRCVQLRCGDEEDVEDESIAKLADEFVALTESGDVPKFTAWCYEHEKLESRQLSDFLFGVKRRLTEKLKVKPDKKRIMGNIELIDRCLKYQTVNTGVKHIFGLLTVRSAMETRKQVD